MRGSLKLFTLFGIPVHMHWSFGLVFIIPMYYGYMNGYGLQGTIGYMIFMIPLFGCVLLHEYGHSLIARRYGVPTQDIILTPIGGVARMQSMPEKPVQEFLVAIAGPLVNVAIAILLFLLAMVFYRGEHWHVFQWFLSNLDPEAARREELVEMIGSGVFWFIYFFTLLLISNIGLVVFNLIPAFPMDGGRIFRSLLAMRLGRVRATRAASLLGQAIAVFFVGIGIFQGPLTLALIGVFVFTMARAENAMVQLEDILKRNQAGDLMRRDFTRLSENDWMQIPIELQKQGKEHNFLVFDLNDQLAGKLREQMIVSARQKRDLSTEVRSYMDVRVPAVTADEPLRSVYVLLSQAGSGIIGVLENGELAGVIEDVDLQRFLSAANGRLFGRKASNKVA